MRRFFVGVALFTLAAVTPLAAWGGDREIAEQIFAKLQEQKTAGVLQGFDLGLDVKEGKVLLKGHVSTDAQKSAVLAAANTVEGVSEVVDQISVGLESKTSVTKPVPVKIDTQTGAVETGPKGGFSLSKALLEKAPAASRNPLDDGMVVPAGTTEGASTQGASTQGASTEEASTEETGYDSDAQLKRSVIQALGQAQRNGQLRGFGVEVSANGGDVLLRGNTRDSRVKSDIMEMVRRMPGVNNVIDDITVLDSKVAPVAAQMPYGNEQQTPYQPAATRMPVMQDVVVKMAEPMPSTGSMGYADGGYSTGGYAGTPVPMSPIPQAYGAPTYDSPNLPNYAWPGYAAYPNYAALTYPQQYSPAAWPYIGPFYPYPQVPLGWRKVSLEWDDGWWFLDFTDK